MIHSAVRRIQFAAGHRVYQHESKCAHPHGHNYVAFLHARVRPDLVLGGERAQLDSVGRVIDFSVLKAKVGGWIELAWDHGFIWYERDEAMRDIFGIGAGYKAFCSPVNPTAENMAQFLLGSVGPQVLMGTGVELHRVVLWETENCYAEVSLPGGLPGGEAVPRFYCGDEADGL